MAIAFLTRMGQGEWHDNIKFGSGKWSLKRWTFRGALWLSQSLKHFWEQISASSCQRRRLALYPARVMNSRSLVCGLRIPSTLWPLVGRMGAGLWILISLLLLDKHITKWDCSASRYRFPDISEMLLSISQLFYVTRFFNGDNRFHGLFANLSL